MKQQHKLMCLQLFSRANIRAERQLSDNQSGREGGEFVCLCINTTIIQYRFVSATLK